MFLLLYVDILLCLIDLFAYEFDKFIILEIISFIFGGIKLESRDFRIDCWVIRNDIWCVYDTNFVDNTSIVVAEYEAL